MRISDWSSDVCSYDLRCSWKASRFSSTNNIASLLSFPNPTLLHAPSAATASTGSSNRSAARWHRARSRWQMPMRRRHERVCQYPGTGPPPRDAQDGDGTRSEEHTSELQSLMRISYAVFCLKKKTKKTTQR